VVLHETEGENRDAVPTADVPQENQHLQIIGLFDKKRLLSGSPLGNVRDKPGNVQLPFGSKYSLDFPL